MTAAAAHDQHLAQAADHLRAAIAGDKPLLDGAQGLRSLFYSLGSGQPLDPQLAGEVSQLLIAVAPRIADATSGRLAAEHVFVALGCASAAMGNVDADRLRGLMAFAAVLEAEIRALHLRDFIAAGSLIDGSPTTNVPAAPCLRTEGKRASRPAFFFSAVGYGALRAVYSAAFPACSLRRRRSHSRRNLQAAIPLCLF